MDKHRVLQALVAVALVLTVAPVSSRAGEPLAIVSAVRGKVEIVPPRAKSPQRAVFGRPLQKGDRVQVGRGAAATILFSDGNVIDLAEQSSVTIGARVDRPARAEVPSEVFAQITSFVTGGSRQTGLVALSGMRGESEGALLVSPRKTSVLDARPSFAWRRVPGATRYLVKVSTESGSLWSRESADTSLAYPADAEPLPADADALWEVEARSENGGLRQESTFIHLPAPAVAEDVRRHLKGIDAIGGESGAANFLAGSYLSAEGFYQEAIGRFQALCQAFPDSPDPHEALARTYASVGLLDLATTEYQRALELSRAP